MSRPANDDARAADAKEAQRAGDARHAKDAKASSAWPLYNPALLPPERITLGACLRRPLAERLLALLRRIGKRGAPQHQLVLGAPGSGKTMLLRALQSAIASDTELAARWLPLTFAEAQWDVARPADVWVNALEYLCVALTRMREPFAGELARELELRVADLPSDEHERNPAALGLLVSMADRLERRFVLLVDTLDVVLERLKRDEWHVREVLSAEPRLLVIGTSARAIEATYRYDAAFYDFFQLHELRPLPREALPELSGLHPDDPLGHVRELARRAPHVAEALCDVIGTQPRALALLGTVLQRSPDAPAPELALAVLDLLTPAMRARMDALAPQSQQVVHALAASWHPARPNELAQRTRLSANVVSAQLHRLVQDGIVDKTPLPGARHGFLLADRIFQVWLLMRMGQPHRRRLFQVVELLAEAHRGGLVELPVQLLGALDAGPDLALRLAPELRPLVDALEARARAEPTAEGASTTSVAALTSRRKSE